MNKAANRWYQSVPTMDAVPTWHPALITEMLAGGLCNIKIKTFDGRWLPRYGVKLSDLPLEAPEGLPRA
jgi:hypothetical protein